MSRTSGRPRADGKESGAFAKDNPLYDLLVEGFPQLCEQMPDGNGGFTKSLNIKLFSERLGYSRFHVYRSINERTLSVELARKIAATSDGLVQFEELKSYLPKKIQSLLND